MFSYYSEHHKCKLFVKDDLVPLYFPCVFADSLSQSLIVYATGIEDRLAENPIEEDTERYILNRLEQFLNWVEEYSRDSQFVSLENHHHLPNELLNYYVNEILIEGRGRGEASVKQTIQALKAYYNYLYRVGIRDNIINIFMKPELRSQARTNTKSRTSIKYLTPELRNVLYQNTSTIRDELLLKTGGECGLRSKENQGFLMNDFRVGVKKHQGLLSLFKEMDNKPEKQEFEYYLQGIFSKSIRHSGGKSRTIFLHRDLLRRFKEYYDEERPISNSNFFFLNDSAAGNTDPISKNRPTKIFKEVRDKVMALQEQDKLAPEGQCLEEGHTYHILRHSFGTDKFYTLAKDNNMAVDDVTSTSQVYITVSVLMGHSATGKYASRTTQKYIRSCNIKENFSY